MPDLTIAERFGNDVSFDEASKVLLIDLNNLSDITINGVNVGLDVTSMTDGNKDEYAAKILWSLLQLSQANQPEDNNDETVGVYLTNQGKRTVSRNSVAQFGFQLVATAYQNDSVGTVLDPDNIGA